MDSSERVSLYKLIRGGYNPATGKNSVTTDTGVRLPCQSAPLSLDKTSMMFGSIDRKMTTVWLLNRYDGDADVAKIGNDKFKVVRHVSYDTESVLYLESVTEWT